MTTITQKRTTKTMAVMGIKGLLNLCFIPYPLLQNHQKISIITCFWRQLVLINVEMLVMTKNSNLSDFVDYETAGPKMNFLSVFTLLMFDVL